MADPFGGVPANALSVSQPAAQGADASIPLRAVVPKSQNPLASDNFIDTMNSINKLKKFPGEMTLQQQQISQGVIDTAQKQRSAANGYLVPLLNNQNPTLADVTRSYGQGEADGVPTAPQIADATKTFPVDGTAEQRQQWVQARASQSGLSPENRMAINRPSQGPLANIGGALQPTTIGPLVSQSAGVVQPSGSAIPVGLSAGEASEPFAYKDPSTGQMVQTTKGAYAAKFGLGSMAFPGQSTSSPGGAVTPPAQGGATQPATGPAVPGVQPRLSSGAPSPSSVTGAQPQQRIDASENALVAARQEDSDYAQRQFPLTQASDLLSSGDTTTGPGAAGVNKVKEWLTTRASTFGWKPAEIQEAKFDELNKYLTQIVNTSPLAARSDQALASTLGGSPSAHISTLANQDVVKAIIGLQRMQHMALTDFDNSGAPYGQWQNFIRQWQTRVDPRAFIFDQLSDAQKEKMVAGMDGTSSTKQAERAAFGRSLDMVEKNPEILGAAVMPR